MIHVRYRPRIGATTIIHACAALWAQSGHKVGIIRPRNHVHSQNTSQVKHFIKGDKVCGHNFDLIIVDMGGASVRSDPGFYEYLNENVFQRKSPGGKVVVFVEGDWSLTRLIDEKEVKVSFTGPSLDALSPMRMLTVYNSDLTPDWAPFQN